MRRQHWKLTAAQWLVVNQSKVFKLVRLKNCHHSQNVYITVESGAMIESQERLI